MLLVQLTTPVKNNRNQLEVANPANCFMKVLDNHVMRASKAPP
jgi:hypothetical protein